MDKPMTLIERLRNPQWIGATTSPFDPPSLDVKQTRKDMIEAADELVRLRKLLLDGWPTKDLVDRFLAWPLPKSVRSDLCVTMDYPHARSGTNLLTADEARQMIEYLLAPKTDNS